MIVSSDMNHYADDQDNRRRDRLALDALATGDPKLLIDTCRAHEISMCGLVPAAFVLETLRQLGHAVKVRELRYSTSADVSGDKSSVVGYAGALFQ
jgi:AmmeMemoRadiSam system protein B